MNEEAIKEKKKIRDTRKHLSDKLCRGLKGPGSVGDDEVIGLRVHRFEGGSVVFYYHYSDKKNGKKRHKEKIGGFPNINVPQARKEAKKISVRVMEGVSASQIKRERKTEPTVVELTQEYVKTRLKEPKYKPSTQERWKYQIGAWIYKTSKDDEIKTMFIKSKIDMGSKKLSDVNMENLREFHRFIGSKSESGANSLVEILGVIFNYAVEKKLIAENPVQFGVEDLYEKKEDNRRLTRQQMDTVLGMVVKYDERSKPNHPRLNLNYYLEKKLNPVSCCLIGYDLLCGKRIISEGAKITWDDISFHEKKLFLDKTKVGQKEYRLGPKVLKLLKAIRNEKVREGRSPFVYSDERSKCVFPSFNFNKVNHLGKKNKKPHISNIRRTWRRVLKELNIPYLPAYNCRHSYLTDALSKVKSVPIVGEMAGHSKRSGYKSTLRYAKVLGSDVAEALETIDQDKVKETKVLVPKVVGWKK
jgi:integrase